MFLRSRCDCHRSRFLLQAVVQQGPTCMLPQESVGAAVEPRSPDREQRAERICPHGGSEEGTCSGSECAEESLREMDLHRGHRRCGMWALPEGGGGESAHPQGC